MQIAPTLILALMLLGPILGANAATVDPSDAAGRLKRAVEAMPSADTGRRDHLSQAMVGAPAFSDTPWMTVTVSEDDGVSSVSDTTRYWLDPQWRLVKAEYPSLGGAPAKRMAYTLRPDGVRTAARLWAEAVPWRLGRQFPGRPQVVDPTKAPDQFGIPSTMFDDLINNIVPGTFRSGRP